MHRQLLSLCLLLSTAAVAHADMYKYTDDTGTVCLTNSLESVPKKYRPNMSVVREEPLKPARPLPAVQKRESPAEHDAVRDEQKPAAAKPETRSTKDRYLLTVLVFAGIAAGFIVLRQLGSTLGFPGTGTLLFLLITLLGGVYLYRMYISELNTVFGTLKTDAMNIRKNVETREQKTDQLLKQQIDKEKPD